MKAFEEIFALIQNIAKSAETIRSMLDELLRVISLADKKEELVQRCVNSQNGRGELCRINYFWH